MKDMHRITTHIPKGESLHHTFNYDTHSKTGFVEDPKTKYATAQSFFESKLKRVPSHLFITDSNAQHIQPCFGASADR